MRTYFTAARTPLPMEPKTWLLWVPGWCFRRRGCVHTIPLFEKAENFGINLKFIENPTEVEKFHEIQKSKLMLFPSYFEGFGYPPLEALYMDTPVVCYDLPVLRETTEGCDGIYFADRGNFDDLKIKIQKALQSQPKNMRAAIFKNTNFEERSKSLNTLVSEWTSSVSSWCK